MTDYDQIDLIQTNTDTGRLHIRWADWAELVITDKGNGIYRLGAFSARQFAGFGTRDGFAEIEAVNMEDAQAKGIAMFEKFSADPTTGLARCRKADQLAYEAATAKAAR